MYSAPCRAIAAWLILGLAAAAPAAATPSQPAADKPRDRIEAASRALVCAPSGSATIVSNIMPHVELDTGELLSALRPAAAVGQDMPFPADAADLQNWIGEDEPVVPD